MSADVIVFLGPTLARADAEAELAASYRPPVRLGDVLRAAQSKPKFIAIIDGLFDGTPPVWHKEVLYAIEQGVQVYGSSSMGALRAAELEAFGMVGVGSIFEAFRDGDLEDDDEVAVLHGPAPEFVPLCEAMVNLRHGLSRAREQGLLHDAGVEALVARSKARHYRDRSWPALYRDAAEVLPEAEAERLRAFLERTRPNLKREDALALLRRVADDLRRGAQPRPVSFTLERTQFWEKLEHTTLGARGHDVRDEDIRRSVMLGPQGRQVELMALAWTLMEKEAARLGMTPTPEEIREYKALFRRQHGLSTKEDMRRWLERDAVDGRALDRLARWTWLADRLRDVLGHHLRSSIILELKRRGLFGERREHLTAVEQTLRKIGQERPTLEDSGVSLKELLDWYRGRVVVTDRELTTHAQRLRFDGPAELVQHLLREYLYEREDDADTRPSSGRGANGT